MKKSILAVIVISSLSSCYYRIGDLNVVSNKNYDSSKKYILLQSNVEAKAKTKKGDVLEQAVDNAVTKSGGHHLENCKIYVHKSGKKVKVVGDVYGEKLETIK